jgi:hypothetical protein
MVACPEYGSIHQRLHIPAQSFGTRVCPCWSTCSCALRFDGWPIRSTLEMYETLSLSSSLVGECWAFRDSIILSNTTLQCRILGLWMNFFCHYTCLNVCDFVLVKFAYRFRSQHIHTSAFSHDTLAIKAQRRWADLVVYFHYSVSALSVLPTILLPVPCRAVIAAVCLPLMPVALNLCMNMYVHRT